MPVGEFINITNYRQFENIAREIMAAPDLDPTLVFQSAVPGFLQRLFKDAGAWPSREQKAWEFPNKLNGARSVSPNERARMDGYAKRQIVSMPGWEIAGRTQTVGPSDFMFQGMTQTDVTARAMRPRLDWNKTVFSAALDVISATGKTTGAPVANGKYTINDFDGNSVAKTLVTDSADQCGDVIANASQSVLWPLRDGTEAAANHQHTFLAAGAAWTLALGRTHRDTIVEHPNNPVTVECYVGKNTAEDIRAVMKSELNIGGVTSGEAFVKLGITAGGGLGDAVPIVSGLEGVTYYYAPDMDADQALYVASGKRPFYYSSGAMGVNGVSVGTGPWFEEDNKETRRGSYGFREYQNLGCDVPVDAAIVDYVA